MKRPHVLAGLGLSLLATSSRCEKEAPAARPAPGPAAAVAPLPAPCSGADVAPLPVPGWALAAHCLPAPLAGVGQSRHYVVRSAAEYGGAATCPPPALDYGHVSLLCGKTKTAYTSRVVAQRVTRTCTGVKYTIHIENGLGAALSEVAYFAVVPRLASDATVEFDVQVR